FIAYLFYKRDESFSTAKRLATQFAPIYNMIANKYYVDEIYNGGLLRATVVFAQALAWFDTYIIDGMVNLVRNVTVYLLGYGSSLFDRFVVDGAVNGVAYAADAGSRRLRKMQTGFVQNYALVMGGGIVLIAAVYLFLKP